MSYCERHKTHHKRSWHACDKHGRWMNLCYCPLCSPDQQEDKSVGMPMLIRWAKNPGRAYDVSFTPRTDSFDLTMKWGNHELVLRGTDLHVLIHQGLEMYEAFVEAQ